MSNIKVSGIQHCVEPNDRITYAQEIKDMHNVNVTYDTSGFDDELNMEGDKDNVKKAILTFYGEDVEQAEFNCPELF